MGVRRPRLPLMRAARFHTFGGAPVVDEVATPLRGFGETLVRMEAAAVSHLDLTVAGGDFRIRPQLPHIGGLEGAGVVLESEVHEIGALVAVRGGGLGLQRDGCWAELVAVPDECAAPVHTGMTAQVAATYRQPVATAAVTLWDVAGLGTWPSLGISSPAEETVLVTGAAGAVGSVVAQLAVRAGCRVLGLVRNAEQAARLGGQVRPVVVGDASTFAELARERPITLLVDNVGGADLAARTGWVSPGGRAAVVGYVAGTAATLDLPGWLLEDVALLPVNMMRRQAASARRTRELAPLVASGGLRIAVESYPLDDAPLAVARMRAGGVGGRVVLCPGSAERTD